MNSPAKTSKRIARTRASRSSSRLRTRHDKPMFWNALDGRCARWSGACVLTAGFYGELMIAASYIFNRIPHSTLNIETPYKKLYGKDADLFQLKIIDARIFVHIKTSNKLGHTSWEGMTCNLNEPATPTVSGTQKRVAWWKTGTSFSSKHHQICFPRPGGSRLGDNYVSHEDMLQDVQNYTSDLDFGVDAPAGTVELLLPQQVSPDVASPGGASPAGILPVGVTPEGSSPSPAPTPASAAPKVANGHADCGTVGVTPAVTRSRAASLLPVPVATRYGGGRNSNRATLAELFEAGTLQHVSELELRPPC